MPTLRIRNAANTGWVDAATAAGFRIRNTANTGWINKTASLAGVAVRNVGNNGWLTFSAGGASYSVSPSVSSVTEGSSVVYAITTTGVTNGTVLYWTNSGTTVAADFSDAANSGTVTINSNSGTITRTLTSDGATEAGETIILQLRTVSTSGTVVATASTVSVSDSSGVPSQLSLYYNDLDFAYLPTATSAFATTSVQVDCLVNSTTYFANGGNHIAFCIDATGAQGSNNPHCGPIYRNGGNLWSTGRGFIIFADGSVISEEWNGTMSPGLSSVLGTFNRAANPIFNIKINAGYRSGTYANTMRLRIWSSDFSSLLMDVSVPWGWDWSGSHRVAIAGIANGFVIPAATGCVESLVPQTAPSAVLPFSNFNLTLF